MKKILVVGGNSGIGLSICKNVLNEYDHVYIVGRDNICYDVIPDEYKRKFKEKTSFYKLNFVNDDFSVFEGQAFVVGVFFNSSNVNHLWYLSLFL